MNTTPAPEPWIGGRPVHFQQPADRTRFSHFAICDAAGVFWAGDAVMPEVVRQLAAQGDQTPAVCAVIRAENAESAKWQ